MNFVRCDIAGLPVTFEIPEDLEAVTFEGEPKASGLQLFFVPKDERAMVTGIPSANARGRIRGSVSATAPAAGLPGAAQSDHGVEHYLYPALTPEGDPTEWFVVVPLQSGTLSFTSALADSAALQHLSRTLARR